MPSDSKIEVNLIKTPSDLNSFIIIDGNQEVKIEDKKDFKVTKSEKSFKLLHPVGHDFSKLAEISYIGVYLKMKIAQIKQLLYNSPR